MKEGLSWFFSGGFEGPLQATSWKNRFSSQANPDSLEKSRIRVLVACLYAHPFLTLSLRDSIRRQLEQAERFVASRPGWIIARDAAQARVALASGKKVIVLSLELADGVLETEDDLKEFIDRRGIRIVNLLHLTDDDYGGVAFMAGWRAIFSPGAFLSQLFRNTTEDGIRLNPRGLTEEGRKMADSLARRGVWLDLTHASDASQRQLLALQEELGHPPLYTHTVLRGHYRAERALADWQVAAVRERKGYVGLMPAQDMLQGTPGHCEEGCHSPCDGGLHALARHYSELATSIDPDSIALGSDTNGGVEHLPPTCKTGTVLDREGFWNIGQTAEVWRALRAVGAPVPASLAGSVDRFVDAWSRVKPATGVAGL